jgi:RNA polymerase sigma-70 factor (ECF subfamily)
LEHLRWDKLRRFVASNGFPADHTWKEPELMHQRLNLSANTMDSFEPLADEEIVRRVLAGDLASFELLMRRYNQRVFRVVRSLVGDDDEAEDVLQDAYVRAFEHLHQFEGRSKFSTWLTRIAVHEATARRRKLRRLELIDMGDLESPHMPPQSNDRDAPEHASNRELGTILRHAVDGLPAELRAVFTLRLVEGLDTQETAECLGLSASNVKVRLHRARTLLQHAIDERMGVEVRQLYQFDGERCDRIVRSVMARLAP